MPSTITRRLTRCCDAQGASAFVYRFNAILAARRGGRVDRERSAIDVRYSIIFINGSVLRINTIIPGTTSCRTRCCDAQGAGASVFRINAITAARRVGRVNRERGALVVISINAIFSFTRRGTRCCDAQGRPCALMPFPRRITVYESTRVIFH